MIAIEYINVVGLDYVMEEMKKVTKVWLRLDINMPDRELVRKLVATDHVYPWQLRAITVYADITAPMYWWDEFSIYGARMVEYHTLMSKILEKELTLDDFSVDKLFSILVNAEKGHYSRTDLVFREIINALNLARDLYLKTEEPKLKEGYLQRIIQLLPGSYNKTYTVALNYEILTRIFKERSDHKKDEWSDLCNWIRTELPYSELITGIWEDSEEGESNAAKEDTVRM